MCGCVCEGDNDSGKEKKPVKERVAFKTKSDVEILDDGFKWRKYGKKMVKNSPNPRLIIVLTSDIVKKKGKKSLISSFDQLNP